MNGWVHSFFWRLAIVAAALALASCASKGDVIEATQADARAKWADVEKAYRARAMLIPTELDELASNAPDAEQEMLSEVLEARRRALRTEVLPENLDNPVMMDSYFLAQGQLAASINHLVTSSDKLPDLDTVLSPGMLQMQAQMSGGRIQEAISAYNQAASRFNQAISSFPNNLTARVIYGIHPMVLAKDRQATTPGD
jgi:LemA protein